MAARARDRRRCGCGRLCGTRARLRHGGVVRRHFVARPADAFCNHRAGAGIFRSRDAAACRRQCPPDATLPRLCRTGDRDDGAAERAGPFCTHRVFAAAVQYRLDRGHDRTAGIARQRRARRADSCGHGRRCRPAATRRFGLAARRQHRNAAADFVRRGNPRLSRQGRSRHDREQHAAAIDGGRRDRRVVIAVGGVVALFRQPPGRTAARHRRRRHGHGADSGIDARLARRRSSRGRACGIARPRTRGRAGAAGDAGADRAQRTRGADAVRTRRVHVRTIPRPPRAR